MECKEALYNTQAAQQKPKSIWLNGNCIEFAVNKSALTKMEWLCAICYQSLSQITPKIYFSWSRYGSECKLGKRKGTNASFNNFEQRCFAIRARLLQINNSMSHWVNASMHLRPFADNWRMFSFAGWHFSSGTNHIVILIESTVKRLRANEIILSVRRMNRNGTIVQLM